MRIAGYMHPPFRTRLTRVVSVYIYIYTLNARQTDRQRGRYIDMTRSGRPTPCRGTWGCTRESPADVRIRSNTHVHPSRSGALLRQSLPNSANAECPPPQALPSETVVRSFARSFVSFRPCATPDLPPPLSSLPMSPPASQRQRRAGSHVRMHIRMHLTLCALLCAMAATRAGPPLSPFSFRPP